MPRRQLVIRRSMALMIGAMLVFLATTTTFARPPIVLVAGDIASGRAGTHEADTAKLVRSRRGLVMTSGDNAYESGTRQEFRDYYHPTWGAFRGRTRPTPGNHDYDTAGASGYFGYFGSRAGPGRRGYYTFKHGTWRVFALNSEICGGARGCGPGSRQFEWLRRKLKRSNERCTLAVWHRPLSSSGVHGRYDNVRPLVRILYQHGAEIVVNGHDHDYERLAPANHRRKVARKYGIRQFVVGTGGTHLRARGSKPEPLSRAFQSNTWGVLQLKLRKRTYNWRFLPIAGQDYEDAGKGWCHGRPRK